MDIVMDTNPYWYLAKGKTPDQIATTSLIPQIPISMSVLGPW